MIEPTDAPMLPLQLAEDELLAVEYDLSRPAGDLDEQAEAEQRDRYDEQIYAALVAPSF